MSFPPNEVIPQSGERHPRAWRVRIVRQLRACRRLRGWRRVASAIIGRAPHGEYLVKNQSGWFAGNLNSFIEREVYLYGGYEDDEITVFLQQLPPRRAGIILDIGANIGTHSIAFARHFSEVHAFEPNEMLWPRFNNNVAINKLENVTLHPFGLSNVAGQAPFYVTEKDNVGLGTAVSLEQYDVPLRQAGVINIKKGDEVVSTLCARVDAIKVDVQGLEPQVLSGLEETLHRDRPTLWVEVGMTNAGTTNWLAELLPRPANAFQLSSVQRGLIRRTHLIPADPAKLSHGNFVIVPT